MGCRSGPHDQERAGHRIIDEIVIPCAGLKDRRIGRGMRRTLKDPAVSTLQFLPRKPAQCDLGHLLRGKVLVHDSPRLAYSPELAKELMFPEKGKRQSETIETSFVSRRVDPEEEEACRKIHDIHHES